MGPPPKRPPSLLPSPKHCGHWRMGRRRPGWNQKEGPPQRKGGGQRGRRSLSDAWGLQVPPRRPPPPHQDPPHLLALPHPVGGSHLPPPYLEVLLLGGGPGGPLLLPLRGRSSGKWGRTKPPPPMPPPLPPPKLGVGGG